MSSPYDKVLDYYDILLRKGDIDTLKDEGWINDQIVDFYFEYCLREMLGHTDKIAFVGGGKTFFIANGEHHDYAEALAPLSLEKKDLIFFSLINNPFVDQYDGGSHWSLLVFERNTNKFVHYDSCQNLNAMVARKIIHKITKLLDLNDMPSYIEEETSQQTNTYDCGIYMLLIAEKLSLQYLKSNFKFYDSKLIMNEVNESNATQLRQNIIQLIDNLKS